MDSLKHEPRKKTKLYSEKLDELNEKKGNCIIYILQFINVNVWISH